MKGLLSVEVVAAVRVGGWSKQTRFALPSPWVKTEEMRVRSEGEVIRGECMNMREI